MKNDWKERLVVAIFVGVIIFMMSCVSYKLFFGEADWLSRSVIWSVCWSLGYFISKNITAINCRLWKILGYDLIIIFMVSILLMFFFGVILNMADWNEIVFSFMWPFGLSLILNNKWIRN